MSRYAAMFESLKIRDEGACGAFVSRGDPDLATSAALLDACVEGAPTWLSRHSLFGSDRRRAVIQAAAARARRRSSGRCCFALIAGFRQRHAAVPSAS